MVKHFEHSVTVLSLIQRFYITKEFIPRKHKVGDGNSPNRKVAMFNLRTAVNMNVCSILVGFDVRPRGSYTKIKVVVRPLNTTVIYVH